MKPVVVEIKASTKKPISVQAFVSSSTGKYPSMKPIQTKTKAPITPGGTRLVDWDNLDAETETTLKKASAGINPAGTQRLGSFPLLSRFFYAAGKARGAWTQR